jgi:hypothetical protein
MQDDYSDPTEPQEIASELDDGEEAEREPVEYRGTGRDPTFGYLIALALSFGLLPLIPNNADLRYTLVWGLLALIGVLSWLFGTTTRIGREKAEDIVWGAVLGLIVAAPLLLVGSAMLTRTVTLIFQTGIGGEVRRLPPGAVLAYVIFVMPLAESLFFRGYMQQNRSFWLVGILSGVWSLILFVPMLEVGQFPLVALIIAVLLVLINLVYSYVRDRNGLAAAWVCQIVVSQLHPAVSALPHAIKAS